MVLEDGWMLRRSRRWDARRRAAADAAGNERYDCRNNRLLLALDSDPRARSTACWAAWDRSAWIVLASSTSGIDEGEAAMVALQRTSLAAALPLRHAGNRRRGAVPGGAHVRVSGPAYTVSTACTSSAKAIASAARLLRAESCDAVLDRARRSR